MFRGIEISFYNYRIILEDWGTQNARVRHLIKVLCKARLYAAADYLAVTHLHGDPVPREDEPILSPVGSCSLTPNEQRNLENKKNEKTELYNRDKVPDTIPVHPDSTTDISCRSVDSVRHDAHSYGLRTPS